MTRIDFHSNVPDKIAYACRLIRKARAAKCRIVVFDSDRAQLERLNQALWTFSEQDFLPHVMAGDPLATQTPVVLSASDDAEFPHHELLINLTSQTPGSFARFERMIELVSTSEQDTLSGRERYKFYQQRGYALTHSVAKLS
ncbi:DNA polymerase III subunit chi [Undibacterium sp. TJN25]|uniref:DNA polymerase III subunit chi n=1 Tax=Undibacterium sp. TJN25 TaxID=3413056 RepID=UPI003BF25E9A